jgi:two-component system nitrogen regulation response regulator NtrX
MPFEKSLESAKVLIVDDHRNIRVTLKMALSAEGADVTEAENAAKARTLLEGTSADIPFHTILLDIRLPDGSGLDLLKLLSDRGLASRVIMISGEGTVTEAFRATQMGAFDYIEKPFTPERILVSVKRCLEFNNIRTSRDELQKKIFKGQEILGAHARINDMIALVKRVAATNSRVLISGETGTGKELVAKAIHRQSERSHKPLIKVNCAAIPHSLIESELFGHEKGSFTGALKQRRGLFEQADQGTLLLDEIGELSADVQAKLLRTLETGEVSRLGSEKTFQVDVRVLAATHRDLAEMVKEGEFREDLYYRLNVVTVLIPPLRERLDDVRILAQHFLELACEDHSLGDRSWGELALKQMQSYGWPGNIRELKNLVERTAILSETAVIEDIPELEQKISAAPGRAAASIKAASEQENPGDPGAHFKFESLLLPWDEFHRNIDRMYLIHVLHKTGGNVSEASRLLCLERAYLHRLMKKLGVQREVVVSE